MQDICPGLHQFPLGVCNPFLLRERLWQASERLVAEAREAVPADPVAAGAR